MKSGPEHELYEIIQGIERHAIAEKRPINDIEAAQINSLRRQSLELYQQAWQPYITTHNSGITPTLPLLQNKNEQGLLAALFNFSVSLVNHKHYWW